MHITMLSAKDYITSSHKKSLTQKLDSVVVSVLEHKSFCHVPSLPPLSVSISVS